MPSGIGGFMKVNVVGRLDVRMWRFRKEAQVQKATTTAAVDGWERKEATNKDASGSCEVLFDTTQVLEADVDISIDIGETHNVQFNIGLTGWHYDGAIVIKSMETVNNVDGSLIGQTVEFESDGPFVLTPP